MSTADWLSAAVENTCDFFVGIVVFLSIIFVHTPPIVSRPSESGVTSRSNNPSLTSPPRTPPWYAAPSATHSSGLIPLNGSLPINCLTASWTAGILEEPPTISTLWRSEAVSPLSCKACFTGPIVAWTRSEVSSLNLACVSVRSRCLGPVASAVMNGRLMLDVGVEESSILAFSAASLSLCIAILSFLRSIPSDFLNSSAIQSITLWSKSSPPRRLFPAVARTSVTPSPISITETSKVPPPRSYTITFWSSSLSIP